MDDRAVEATPKARPARRAMRVRTLVALVACCAALSWAYRAAVEGMRPVTRLARLVRSGDADDRQLAARQLGDSALDDLEVAVPALVAALGDDEELVRAEAASGLGLAGITAIRAKARPAEAKEAALALTRALGDSGPQVRMAAASALGELAALPNDLEFPADPAPVASALVGLLIDPSEMIRVRAESALVRVAARAPLEPPPALVGGVDGWPSKESREAAALALGSFRGGVGPTVRALTRALRDKEPEVRSAAASALRNFGADAAPALPSLVEALADPFVPPPPREFSVVAQLSGRGGFSGGDDDGPTDPAAQAARAIGRIVQPQVEKGTNPPDDLVEALNRALHSDRPALRDAAGAALRRIGKGASAAIPPLIRDLVESTPKPGPGFGPTAATALGDIAPGTDRADGAVAALTSALDAGEPDTRLAAIKALAKFGPAASAALPRLREIASEPGIDPVSATSLRSTTDQIEGKAPPDRPRRKGQGGRGRGVPLMP